MPENSKQIAGRVVIPLERSNELKEKIKNIVDFKEEIEKSSTQDITAFLESMLVGAINFEASDLHIEPSKDTAKIRARIDGFLQDAATINYKIYQGGLSRIKLLSGTKLNISDRPQDGRFSISMEGFEIEIRASVLPTEHGEAIVLRILNPKSLVEIESLGLRKDLLEIFEKEIKKPNGMIIVTGPTGSGKTTTLYAFLKRISRPEIKIITIEDPVEYHIEGLSQTQVNPSKGYDFASGLQSIVRQDPDVILVGEIRDSKTCQIALQAALTGHLVFTTLHTNDAAGTIARLISLEGNLANIGPAINLSVAQRLVRQICPKCTEFKKISPENLNKIKKELENIKEKIEIPKVDESLKIADVKGCKECNLTGYKGRIAAFEVIAIDDEMEKFILNNPSIAAFREEATKKGMVTMQQDGLIKVIEGLTTIDEVNRVMGQI